MGIARGMVKLLMREGNKEAYKGSVITAGRQDIYATENDLRRWAKEMDFKLTPNIEMSINENPHFRDKNYISDQAFFKSLGFEIVDSMDYSAYQNCTIIHDLNNDLPEIYHSKYDMVFDGGTMEHVFNVPKVFETFNKLTKIGGRIIHASPSSNHVDHGLYMFSPLLFSEYYSANKWEIIDNLLFKYKPSSNNHIFSRLWSVYEYSPGSLDLWIFGGYSGMFGIFCVAKKTKETVLYENVFQGRYRRERGVNNNGDINKIEVKNELAKKTLLQKVAYSKSFISPEIRNLIRPFYFLIASKLPLSIHLKLIGKY